jgi:hypothetical protein
VLRQRWNFLAETRDRRRGPGLDSGGRRAWGPPV